MKSSWRWNRIRLCQLTGKNALHPVTFYAIQTSALSTRVFFNLSLEAEPSANVRVGHGNLCKDQSVYIATTA